MGTRRQTDPAALGRHTDRLYRAARFMCPSPEEAEDLVQETFARVLANPRLLRSDDDLGYLLRVLRTTCVSRRRAVARQSRLIALRHRPSLSGGGSPDDPDARTVLHDAVVGLPDKFRDALVAIDVAGLSYRQAADALGVREATVTTRLHRARERVARQIES